MKRIFIALIACLGAACIVAGAQAQQSCAYCDLPPAACSKFTPKMSLARASFDRFSRTTSIFAPISTRASGTVRVQLLGGRRITEFNVVIDSRRGRIRATRGIDAAQARASTAILTLTYPGDGDTRAQSLRLRAALHPPRLTSTRPVLTPAGVLQARGTISPRARGIVRVQLEFADRTDGSTKLIERAARIVNGRWRLNALLPLNIRALIAQRCTTVQSYVLFTGYQQRLIRGQMRSFQVMPAP